MSPHGANGAPEVLSVFCGADGRHGNRLGVVRDGRSCPDPAARQELARRLGHSETVFVDDPERGALDIYTPSVRLPFAGHPVVGAAWLLDLEVLDLPVGEVWARQDGEFTWIEARAEWAPPRTLRRYASAAEVDALPVPPVGSGPVRVGLGGRGGGPGPRTGVPSGGATASTRTRRRARRPCC